MRRLLSILLLGGRQLVGPDAQRPGVRPQGLDGHHAGSFSQRMDQAGIPHHQPLDPGVAMEGGHGQQGARLRGRHGHEFFRYDRELADIIFHAEFRFTKIENGKGYNSGVMVRNSADGTIWHQAQAGEESAGWLFGNSPVKGVPTRVNFRSQMKGTPVKPAGEWNVYEMTAQGPKITLWVNAW